MNRQVKKVFVAMSGGVDSSVAAALLKKQGYAVTGVFMRPWQPVDKRHDMSFIHSDVRCLWQKDREDAMKVAARIGIPLLTWNFSKEYKKEVADYMIREYKAGRTPNPDVMCNKHIKFGLFLKKALKEGADYIATGHYVRLRRKTLNSKFETLNKLKTQNSKNQLPITNYQLLTARDKNKDQSYFLWTLTQKQLRYCLFPIGDYTKPEVRKIAKGFGLPTADKKDSQGVCFIGPLNMKEFLKKYIKPKKGEILELDKENPSTGSGRPSYKVIGSHDGAFYYTIGQRHGLNIGDGGGPYYVVEKDAKKNILVVAKSDKDRALQGKETELTDVNFIAQRHSNILQSSFDPAKRGQETTPRQNVGMSGMKVSMRTRYRQPLVRAKIIFTNRDCPYIETQGTVSGGTGFNKKSPYGRSPGGRQCRDRGDSIRVLFEKPQKAITPGQSAVFYKGEELLGGGIIE